MKTLAVISGVGAVTSLGLTAPQTAFVYRTGHVGMRESALLDQAGEKITLCSVPTLDPWLAGEARLIQLALPALEEALGQLGEHAKSLRIKVYLCVDEWLAAPRSPADNAAAGQLPAQRVASALLFRARSLAHENVTIETRADGPGAPGLFLEQAWELLNVNAADVIVILAVHSDYDPLIVSELEQRGRLFSSDHLDGLIGGEAAACLLLTTPRTASKLGLTPHVAIHSVGTAYERARPDNDDSAYEAAGLTVASRRALTPLTEAKLKCGWLLADATYEMREVYEWQALVTRSQRALELPQQGDFPAHRLGHLGAAAIPVLLTLIFEAYRRGAAPHPRALLYAGSDAGLRTVLVVSQPDDSKRALERQQGGPPPPVASTDGAKTA
ncbi:MAG: hypothetical protein KIT72_02300 [Polyangiaceae bacterium]|nr:hypothetical protein [Polyangiaceae bacterium]MCW5789229.1 hypothetical protein [Polyangiaceae bacterium]